MCKCEKCGEIVDKKQAGKIILKYREDNGETRIWYILCLKCLNLIATEIESEISK